MGQIRANAESVLLESLDPSNGVTLDLEGIRELIKNTSGAVPDAPPGSVWLFYSKE